MAIFSLNHGDISAFKLLFSLAIMYGLMSMLSYSVLHMKFVKPLGIDAPLDKFSEARAMKHLRVLSEDIVGRHEGRPGLKQAADYIKGQLEFLKDRANSNFRLSIYNGGEALVLELLSLPHELPHYCRTTNVVTGMMRSLVLLTLAARPSKRIVQNGIEVEESMVNGSFNMMFLGHSISLAYRAHTNVLMRISSVNSTETDASVLINAHFDSALNSPGASDCGSCVASMLELGRLIVDSGWIPPRPIIFLFNGAEELFMLGSHGFITTHRWRDTIGAFVNIEASGSGGPDLVCQSGPGSWASLVYAQSAVYPMAQSSAQVDESFALLSAADIFGIIPGDTDYRILAQDHGSIPGLDVIFLLGGYFYHTSSDTVERLVPGSIQARGDNLFSVAKAFASSSLLRNASERQYLEFATDHERAIFFDYMTWFMVYYSKRVAAVLHILPAVIFLAVPIILRPRNFGLLSYCKTYFDFLKGLLQHIIAILMAIIVPVAFAVVRLLLSGPAMNWFANPYLAFMMYVPCSIVGLLIPRYVWKWFHLNQDISVQKMSREVPILFNY
ncbi:Endoplasmic reticulum metallopeptidase 1 [Bienertia sinuspersici]